jgi:hypothetical protein
LPGPFSDVGSVFMYEYQKSPLSSRKKCISRFKSWDKIKWNGPSTRRRDLKNRNDVNMINAEWKRRIDRWRDVMATLFYKAEGVLDFEGFTTFEQLSVETASKRKFKAIPVGTPWGAKWEYGWFKTEIEIPKS